MKGWRREDDDRCADKVQREYPETKAIDDHRCKLPVVCLLVAFHVVFDLPQRLRRQPLLVIGSQAAGP